MRIENFWLHVIRLGGLLVATLLLCGLLQLSGQSALATSFVEEEGKLEVRFSLSDLTGISANKTFLLNEDGKSIWQYVGPETRPDLAGDCNSLNWGIIDETRIKEVEATVVKEGQDVSEVFHVFDLPSEATNEMGYCFVVPTSTAGEAGNLFQYRRLEAQQVSSQPIPGTIKITQSVNLEGTNIPSSLIFAPSTPDLDLVQWQYAIINAEDKDKCQVNEALDLDFSAAEANERDQVELKLSEIMAGRVICVQAQSADTGDFIFNHYVVPEIEEESGGSGTVILVIVGAVVVVAVGAFFIVRSKKKNVN